MRRWLPILLLGVLAQPVAAQPVVPSLPSSAQVAGPGSSATLLDGQRLTLSVAFAPGDPSGPAYPPLNTPFSKEHPAYYPVLDDQGPFHLTIQTALKRATLVLRVRTLTTAASTALPVDRIEYRVGDGLWQAAQPIQVIALLPGSGQASYDISVRLRLEGDELAGESQVLLTWSVEER